MARRGRLTAPLHHGAYKARICQRVSLAEAARPKGIPLRRHAGTRRGLYVAGSPRREYHTPLPPVLTPAGRTKGRKTG